MHDFGVKWGIFQEKMCDFWLNVGFSKRKCVIFGLNGGSFKEKMRDFRLNDGFSERKRVIFT